MGIILKGHFPPISQTIQVRQDMLGIDNEVERNSWVTFCSRLKHMDTLVFVDKQRRTYIRRLKVIIVYRLSS